jgi:putative DNA primase/helicase
LKAIDLLELEYQQLKQELQELQEENRGIYKDENDCIKIDYLDFSDYFQKRCKMFCVGESTYYAYSKKTHCYEICQVRTLKKIARKILGEANPDLYNTMTGARILTALSEDVDEVRELSATPGVVVFQNGTLKLNLDSDKKMEFVPRFSPKNIVFQSLPYDYNPDAECPKFQNFLRECTKDDEDLIALLRDCCANIFAFGETYVHQIVFIWGIGRNGKSVLCDVLNYLFPEMVSHEHLSTLTERFGTSGLVDKVLNISPEADAKIKNTEIIKEISAGSTTMAEFKYKDIFPVRITAKLFVATNSFPYTEDSSKGWMDRLTIIPFEQVFEVNPPDGKKKEGVCYQNPYLLDELKEEREGIAAWLLEGLQDLKERNWSLTYSERAEVLKQKVLMESQPVLLFFRSCVKKSEEETRIKTSEMHASFKQWAQKNEIDMRGFYDSKAFHKDFRRILDLSGCDSRPREVKGNLHYANIKLKDNYENCVDYIV